MWWRRVAGEVIPRTFARTGPVAAATAATTGVLLYATTSASPRDDDLGRDSFESFHAGIGEVAALPSAADILRSLVLVPARAAEADAHAESHATPLGSEEPVSHAKGAAAASTDDAGDDDLGRGGGGVSQRERDCVVRGDDGGAQDAEEARAALVCAAPRHPLSSFILAEWPLLLAAAVLALGSSLCAVLVPGAVGRLLDAARDRFDALRSAAKEASADAAITAADVAAAAAAAVAAEEALSASSASPATSADVARRARDLLALVLAQGALQGGYIACLGAAGERFASRVRCELMGSLLRADITLHDTAGAAKLSSLLGSEVAEVRSAVKHAVSLGLRSAASLAAGYYGMYAVSPRLAADVLAGTAGVVAVGTTAGSVLRSLSRRAHDASRASLAGAEGSISRVRTVRSFTAEDARQAAFRADLDAADDTAARFSLGMGAFQGGQTAAVGALMIAVMWRGAGLVERGDLTAGALTSFLMIAQRAQGALGQLSLLAGELTRAAGAWDRVSRELERVPAIPVTGGASSVPAARAGVEGNVTFRGVTFAYPTRPRAPVLRGVDLEARAGSIIALVGHSGGGKSTIAALLERFYDPTEGTVLLDGVDLRTLDPTWLRSQIAMVSQDPELFPGSIAENIRLGRPGASDAQVADAARRANCHDFITAFPDGYATSLGAQSGASLSGGQRQRIAIARAILRDPKILILDEATSALDARSERSVQEALERLMAGRTVLVIAHRLSTVARADEIAVVDRGEIVERGTHEELLARGGKYAELVNLQVHDPSSADDADDDTF